MKRSDYESVALRWLADHLQMFVGPLQVRIQMFRSDYRMGSVRGDDLLYCESGGLYSTTPEKPSEYIRVKTLNNNKTLATFTIEGLAKNL